MQLNAKELRFGAVSERLSWNLRFTPLLENIRMPRKRRIVEHVVVEILGAGSAFLPEKLIDASSSHGTMIKRCMNSKYERDEP